MVTPEDFATHIVRSILGEVGKITPTQIAEAAIGLGRTKNKQEITALFCDYFLKGYKNCNFDLSSNGERMVLHRLATLHPTLLFDVGANEGEWAQAALDEIPNIFLHAFEIMPATFSILSARMAARASQMIFNDCGLSDHNGDMKMYAFDQSNKLASHIPHTHGASQEKTCRVRKGDDYMREKNIEKIDFLKIDVEGAEWEVVQGFSNAIAQGRVDLIQFEYGKINIVTHHLLYDFYKYFAENDYVVGKIYPDYVDFRPYAFDDEDFLGPNYLACRRGRSDIITLLEKQR